MEPKTIKQITIQSEDHLDAMFVLMEEISQENVLEIKEEKEKVWICEWDNLHGDSTFFR
jgi:hypothetical protein